MVKLVILPNRLFPADPNWVNTERARRHESGSQTQRPPEVRAPGKGDDVNATVKHRHDAENVLQQFRGGCGATFS